MVFIASVLSVLQLLQSFWWINNRVICTHMFICCIYYHALYCTELYSCSVCNYDYMLMSSCTKTCEILKILLDLFASMLDTLKMYGQYEPCIF